MQGRAVDAEFNFRSGALTPHHHRESSVRTADGATTRARPPADTKAPGTTVSRASNATRTFSPRLAAIRLPTALPPTLRLQNVRARISTPRYCSSHAVRRRRGDAFGLRRLPARGGLRIASVVVGA